MSAHDPLTNERASLLEARRSLAHDALEIVCDECGYDPDESDIYQFRRAILEEDTTWGVEYRFMGALGFGGKFYFHSRAFRWDRPSPNATGGDYRCYVSCYPEDRSPVRDAMIAAANDRLSLMACNYSDVFRNA